MSESQEAARESVETLYNDMSRKEAHVFKNVVAAVRLLCGAFASREIGDKEFRRCIEELVEIDPEYVDPYEFLRRHQQYRGDVHFDTGKCLSEILDVEGLERRRVLLVDDQARSAGWTVLFRALLPNKMEFSTTVAEAKETIEDRTSHLACVLLDLQLPDGSSGSVESADIGIELLEWIKSKDISLPVVIFSGVDEVRYARRCFDSGASDFFVKELHEDNRSYIGYFRRLKKLIAEAVEHPEWRDMWGRIRALPAPGEEQMGAPLFRAVETELRRAYMFLTSDPYDARVKLIFENPQESSIYDECVLQCGLAVERIVNYHANKLEKKRAKRFKKKLKEQGYEGVSVRRSRESAVSQLGILQEESILDKRVAEIASNIWGHRNRAAHAGAPKRVEPKYRYEDALPVFEQALELVEMYFGDR